MTQENQLVADLICYGGGLAAISVCKSFFTGSSMRVLFIVCLFGLLFVMSIST